MYTRILSALGGLILVHLGFPLASAQETTAPIYRIQVVERTAKAVNYEYRSLPTKVDLVGTPLLARARGDATVRSRQGRTEIDARLDGLTSPQRYGGEYLTYVLWAITPEGRPHNLGEMIPDSGDKAKLHVTTDLQAFALIVTAEPYSAVRQPSDVVIADNEIRPDTIGKIEPVVAKYELLPRGTYTWQVPSQLTQAIASAPKVSMHEYEALIELYQAQNAVGSAQRANAETYAADTFGRAQQLLAQAQQLHDSKSDFRRVVESAREAAQTAEDSRVLALQRQQTDQLKSANAAVVRAQAEVAAAHQAREKALADTQAAQAEAQQAKAAADAARTQAAAAQIAQSRAESEAAAVREREAQERADREARRIAKDEAREKTAAGNPEARELRARLLADMKGCVTTLDTGRGLVATVPDEAFEGRAPRSDAIDRVARLAAIVAKTPGLRVTVEGHADVEAHDSIARERAEEMRRLMVAHGIAPDRIAAAGVGTVRPLGPNKRANYRVEIIVSGDPIGPLPLWDKPYTLTPGPPNQ